MIKISENVVQWECDYKGCRAICCRRNNPLTIFDVKKIAERKGLNWKEFADFDEDKVRLFLKTGDYGCIFLDDDCKCTTYKYKPLVCRLLPFEISGVVQLDEPILHLKPIDECPGYGQGPNLDEDFMWQVERDATLYLHENQKLCREFRDSKKDLDSLLE
jgi:Fe-S-cluster containining protein